MIHDRAKANASTSSEAATTPPTPWGRNPTAMPTRSMTTTTPALRSRSAPVRPASTDMRTMGSERNRSMMPLPMSSARPMAVEVAPNTTIWPKMPGIR
nr:hypothetical protein [Aquihabitans sp. G128]